MDEALRLIATGRAGFTRMFLLGRFDERFGLTLGTTERRPMGDQIVALAYELAREAQEEAQGRGGSHE